MSCSWHWPAKVFSKAKKHKYLIDNDIIIFYKQLPFLTKYVEWTTWYNAEKGSALSLFFLYYCSEILSEIFLFLEKNPELQVLTINFEIQYIYSFHSKKKDTGVL